jgi:hypothetical protein
MSPRSNWSLEHEVADYVRDRESERVRQIDAQALIFILGILLGFTLAAVIL